MESNLKIKVKKKMYRYILLCALFLLVCCSHAQKESLQLDHNQEDSFIAQVVSEVMKQCHFDQRNIDDELSSRVLDAYIKYWDSNRYVFLEKDIQEFEKYRNSLDDFIPQGKVKIAFVIFNRYMERIQEQIQHIKKILNEPFDFSKKEYINLDRKNAPWSKTKEEWYDLCRKDIKNQVLQHMVNQVLEEEQNNEQTTSEEMENKDVIKQIPSEEIKNKEIIKQTPSEEIENKKVVESEDKDELKEIKALVLKRYEQFYKLLQEYDNYDVLEIFLSCFTSAFDPHSSYMNWRTIQDFTISLYLSLQGIGAVLTNEDGYTKIVSIVPGGPAEKEGSLKVGDYIIAVAQEGEPFEDVVGLPVKKVVRKIRGPKGTKVILRVQKNLHGGTPSNITIERNEIKLVDSEAKGKVHSYKDTDKKYGVISIPSFYRDFDGIRNHDKNAKSSVEDVRNIINKMMKEDKISGLVIDLRKNPGGSLEEAIDLTGLFIPDGPVVQIRQYDSTMVRNDKDGGFCFDLPLVVMVDTLSASSSEIFAAAMQDYGRAIVVGHDTYGKGTVQSLIHLDNVVNHQSEYQLGALKVTTAKYYRVNGGSTQKKGVIPDIHYPSVMDESKYKEGAQDFAMKWDEIKPVTVHAPQLTPIQQYIPAIKKSHKDRIAQNEALKEAMELFQWWEKRKQETIRSLNYDERLQSSREDEKILKRLTDFQKKYFFVDEIDELDTDDKNDKEQCKIFLQEALNILHDLVEKTLSVQNKNP